MDTWQERCPTLRFEPIPDDLSSDDGSKGHVRRLTWIETSLRRRLSQSRHPVLFSPVPEAPLSGKFRTVVTVHDFTAHRYYRTTHPLHIYTRCYVPRVLRRAQRVIAYSQATERDAVGLANVDPAKIVVAPLACDTNHFRDLGLARKRYFIYLGRYAPYKNIESALNAFEKANLADVEFWLAGPDDPGFERLIANFRDKKQLAVKYVEYPPFAALPTLLGEALGMVFLSRSEGFGLPVLEAMACGTPVISSNVSAMPEVAGDAAILVGPDDTDAVATAMRRLATDPVDAGRLSVRGLAHSQKFQWGKTGAATRRVLEELL